MKPQWDASAIGKRLAQVRAQADLSLVRFAEALEQVGFGVSDVAVMNYERAGSKKGTDKIPGDYLAAVCERFRVAPSWLLMGRGEPSMVAAVAAMDKIAEVVERYRAVAESNNPAKSPSDTKAARVRRAKGQNGASGAKEGAG